MAETAFELKLPIQTGTIASSGEKVQIMGIFQKSAIFSPSNLIQGHPGGVVAYPIVVILHDDGSLEEFTIDNIIFDTKNNYSDKKG